MIELSQQLVVRTLHLVGVTLLTGGAATLWLAFRVDGGISSRLLAWFEATFWGAVAIVVFTGLGNLVAFGVPIVESSRGTALALKLGLLLVIVVGSVVRTLAVVRLTGNGVVEAQGRWFRWLYATTGWCLVAIVVLAGVLVRG